MTHQEQEEAVRRGEEAYTLALHHDFTQCSRQVIGVTICWNVRLNFCCLPVHSRKTKTCDRRSHEPLRLGGFGRCGFAHFGVFSVSAGFASAMDSKFSGFSTWRILVSSPPGF